MQTGPTAANKLSSSLAEGCDTLILQITTKRATDKLHIGHVFGEDQPLKMKRYVATNPYKKDKALDGKAVSTLPPNL